LAPRALWEIVRPRRLSGVVVRPLNFTVRRQKAMPQQSPIEPETRSPSMFVYSLLFALVYVGGAVAGGLLIMKFAPSSQRSQSNLGHLLVILGALLPGWVFVRRQQRLFNVSESRRLVAFCIGWVFLLEAVGLAANAEMFRSLPSSALIGILVFALAFDALIVWLVFRYGVRKVMTKYLQRHTQNAV